eukprot:snap_masked-scaffold_20-processed-gene-5.56-mRNA-1 protein AED:1.00 eAED:1.00 QI:0/-1/0/0/-1/1/1/0/89
MLERNLQNSQDEGLSTSGIFFLILIFSSLFGILYVVVKYDLCKKERKKSLDVERVPTLNRRGQPGPEISSLPMALRSPVPSVAYSERTV